MTNAEQIAFQNGFLWGLAQKGVIQLDAGFVASKLLKETINMQYAPNLNHLNATVKTSLSSDMIAEDMNISFAWGMDFTENIEYTQI